MRKFLFVCGKNRLRSPTAEHLFASCDGIVTDSAGINHDADQPLSSEQLEWADIVFVMEARHRRKLQQKFRACLHGKRIVSLDIADDYDYMDDALIALLRSKLSAYLPEA